MAAAQRLAALGDPRLARRHRDAQPQHAGGGDIGQRDRPRLQQGGNLLPHDLVGGFLLGDLQQLPAAVLLAVQQQQGSTISA